MFVYQCGLGVILVRRCMMYKYGFDVILVRGHMRGDMYLCFFMTLPPTHHDETSSAVLCMQPALNMKYAPSRARTCDLEVNSLTL